MRWLFITPCFVMLLVALWLVNGIRTPLMVHIMLLLIFTGWMLGTRALWWCAVACSANIFAVWYAERSGLWHFPETLRGIDMWLIALQFSVILSAIAISALIRRANALL